MKKHNTRKLTNTGRRRFIQTLAGLGVSGAALQHMSKEILAEITDNPEDEVPRLETLRHTNHEAVIKGEEGPEREPTYYTIPREEWEHIEGAQQAMRNLSAELRDKEGVVVSVGEQPGSTRNREVIVSHVSVKEAERVIEPKVNLDMLDETIPDTTEATIADGSVSTTVEDIPTRVESIILEDPTDRCDSDGERGDFFGYSYRDVPGGCAINHSGNSGYGYTNGHPAYDVDSNEYVQVTCAHANDETTEVHQPYDTWGTTYIGTVDQHWDSSEGSLPDYGRFDAATIEMPNDVDQEYRIAEDGSDHSFTDEYTYGTVGWDSIVDGCGEMELLKQGITTGRCDGTIERIYDDFDHLRGFEIGPVARAGGDSGGPHFRFGTANGDDVIYMAGIHCREGNEGENYAYATAIAAVEHQFDLLI